MLQKLKQTGKHIFIYSLGNLSIKIVGLILFPVYATHIPTDDFGMLGLIETITAILIAVFGFRMYVAMMRWWALEKDYARKKTIVATTTFSMIFFLIIIDLILFPLDEVLSKIFFKSSDYADYFKIVIISVNFGIITAISTSLLRILEKSIYFLIINIISFTVILITTIYFIVELKMGIKGIIIGQLIGYILQTILTLPVLLKNISLSFDFKIFTELFTYSAPLILSSLSYSLLNMGDRFIIPFFLSYSFLGIYAAGYKINNFINALFINSFQMGFLPIAFKMFEKPDAKDFFSKVLTYYTLILSFASLGLSVFSDEMLFLLAKNNIEYQLGAKYIPLMALLSVLKGMDYVLMLGLYHAKKTKYNALIVFIGATLNIILNILLIRTFELWGVLLASLITGFIISIFYYKFSNKFYPVNYEWNRIIKIFIAGILLYTISLFVNNFSLYIKLFIEILILINFPIVLYLINFFNSKEKKVISQFYLNWKNPKNWRNNIKNIFTN